MGRRWEETDLEEVVERSRKGTRGGKTWEEIGKGQEEEEGVEELGKRH
jgi:hypothetical protein